MKKVVKWELYKILVARFGLLIILLYLTVQIFLGIYMNSSLQNKINPVLQNYIENYYIKYGGKITPEKCVEIENKKNLIEAAVDRQSNALHNYESGMITDTELDEVINQTSPLINEERAFKIFYNSYLYCKQDINNRYLINTGGYDFALNVSTPNFLLIFLIIILVSLSYSDDIKIKLTEIIKSTNIGFKKLIWCKMLAFMILSFVIVSLEQICIIITASFISPLTDFNAPIQSLNIFSNSNYMITLLQAFLISTLLKFLGLICFSIITSSIILLENNIISGTFSTLCIMFIPYFLFNEKLLYLIIPIPIGFTQPTIYFTNPKNSIIWLFDSTGLLYSIFITLIISFILLLLMTIKYTRHKKR